MVRPPSAPAAQPVGLRRIDLTRSRKAIILLTEVPEARLLSLTTSCGQQIRQPHQEQWSTVQSADWMLLYPRDRDRHPLSVVGRLWKTELRVFGEVAKSKETPVTKLPCDPAPGSREVQGDTGLTQTRTLINTKSPENTIIQTGTVLNTKSPENTIIQLVLGHTTSQHSSELTRVWPAKCGVPSPQRNTSVLHMYRCAWHRFIP